MSFRAAMLKQGAQKAYQAPGRPSGVRVPLTVALLGLALVLPLSATAQELPATMLLTLEMPSMKDGVDIPVSPTVGELLVPWRLEFQNAATALASATEIAITWTLSCDDAGITLVNPQATTLTFVPGQATYQGSATLPIAATPETVGDVTVRCTLAGLARDSNGAMQAGDDVEFTALVQALPRIEATVPDVQRQAGPQEQIPYPIAIKNVGNSRVQVRFEVVRMSSGKWNILVPETLALDPGMQGIAIVTVATPFHNGYNKGSEAFALRAIPTSLGDTQVQGEAVPLEFHSHVRGWYVPGPSPMLLAAGLAGLAALVARRRGV